MDFLKKTKIANHFIFIIVELFSILVALRPRGLRMWPHQSHCSPDQQGQKGPFALAADSTLDFGRPPTSLPVWPDDKIKSSQLFSNVAQKIAAVVFPEKSSSSHQIFWLFIVRKIFTKAFKNSQIWSHCSLPLVIGEKICRSKITQKKYFGKWLSALCENVVK